MGSNLPFIGATVSASPWYAKILLVLVGGVSAALGGLVAMMYQAHEARRVKFEEVMGEQKAKALGKAMRLMNALISVLIHGGEKDVLNYIHENNDWMLDNEPFLPQKAAENWHSVRHNIRSLMDKRERLIHTEDGPDHNKLSDEIDEDWEFVDELTKEAEQVIRTELKLAPFRIHRRQRP